MKTLDVVALKQMINDNEDFLLVDVREENEFDADNMEGHLIPLSEIPSRTSEIPKDKKVVVHCRSGVRSANAIHFLEQQHGYENLYNLEGGILAWNEANH
jgi:sulfur-carrier protein adenylyltransferase/sulfurtransferase